MHVNFATSKPFEFNLKTLKSFDWKTLKNFELTRLYMVIIAVAFLVLMVSYGAIQKLRLDHLQSKVRKESAIVAEIKRTAEETGIGVVTVVSKNDIFKVYESRINWAKVLNDVSNSISNRVTFLSFNGAKEKEGIVEIEGIANDQSALAAMTQELTNLKIFKDVKLKSSDVVADTAKEGEKADKSEQSTIKFNVLCTLK